MIDLTKVIEETQSDLDFVAQCVADGLATDNHQMVCKASDEWRTLRDTLDELKRLKQLIEFDMAQLHGGKS